MTSEITGALIGAGCTLIGILIGNWPSFLMQKANAKLQTDITEKKIQNSFQLAAMDKRLDAHQKAYVMWTKMRSSMWLPAEDRRKVSNEAVEFWNSHCLYLEHEASVQFKNCICNFYEYELDNSRLYEYELNSKERKDARLELKKMYAQIKNTGSYISEGAKYPFIETDQFCNDDKKVIEELGNA